jgi:hypothetical protein
MRILAIALLTLAGSLGSINHARAQTSCKVCADQQKACMKNYAGPTASPNFRCA